MKLVHTIRALGAIDGRGVLRDPMLRWLAVLTPFLALLIRFGVLFATELLRERFDFDLTPYYTLIASTIGIVVPGILGTIIGFLLLDQRDDDTLTALLVTPLSLMDYLRYRLAVPMLLSVPITMIMFLIADLVPMTFGQILAASVCAAPLAPLYALFIGTVASNKVQGFALAKAIGVLFIPSIVAYFLPAPWQQMLGVVPQYFPLKVFWSFAEGARTGWLYVLIGVAWQLVLLRLLARRFARIVRR